LRRKSAEEASRLGADFYPIGGVVPLMDEYRFLDVVQIILEVKSVLPPSAPVHLFGAGHPMIFAMAVALGCDFFDSAAYALYAKDDRYLTVYGTKKLEELHYFPCSCPVCSEYMPAELRKIQKDERELIIAEHNLYASFEEIRTIKQAIREKSLFELVESRIRGHPYLVSGWRQIRKYGRILELYDPSSKQGFFHTGIEGNYRPAVTRHHERVLNVELDLKDIYVISTDESGKADFYLKPAFGVVPATISEIYPAGHAEMPEEVEIESILTGIKGLINFLNHHSDKKFRLYIDEVWDECLKTYNLKLPDNVQIEKLRE
jgi:7-cyano-7-deazaguanine tRNA-ribosyltransferase